MRDDELRLLRCFQGSFINAQGEFIVHKKSNTYFNLASCKNENEVKCKVLEWLSRPAFKTEPFNTSKANNEFHKFISDGANAYLGTNFGEKEWETIYTYLGNNINRALTEKFILSNYNMHLIERKEK